jgi:CheY-like chemotaxis protein
MPQLAQSILIVEDDADVRGALTVFFEGEGYRVVEAAHGEEALRHLRANAAGFCIILLDLWMPVMNGWEFRAEQLKDPALAQVPVLVLTADHAAAKGAAGLAAVGCFTKPIEMDRLLEQVAHYCGPTP